MPETTKVTGNVLKSLLGMSATKHANPDASPDNVTFVNRFSKSEITAALKQLYIKPELEKSDFSAPGIISYLKPTHQEIGQKRLDIEKMRALAPEIEQSKILVSSSIMSPNDLQDGEFLFSFDNVSGICDDPDLSKEVAKLYSDFFNGTLQLGIKSYDWIGDIQYGGGAKPILILPIATQSALRARTTEDVLRDMREVNNTPGFASFESFLQKYDKNDDYFWSGKPITWKDAFAGKNESTLLSDMVPQMESFGVTIPDAFKTTTTRGRNNNRTDKQYQSGLESMIVNLRTRLEEGDVIRVSENPEILRFNTEKKLIDKHEALRRMKAKYQVNERDTPPIEELVTLDENPEGFVNTGHPTIIELPVESVIPIIVPGAPSEHLGYFVLIDEHGQPLTIEHSGMANTSTGCTPGSASAAYEALFGSGCCSAKYFGGQQIAQNAGNMIFQHLVDNYIRARIKGIFNRDDFSLDRFNAISSLLFYRTLERKHTTLVFVPKLLLKYFAFAYRENGSGASKLDEIQFLLSMRTTFIIANLMAMARDAVEHRKVTFNVTDENANIEGIMDDIANVFNAKMKLNGSIDPSEIMRDMYTNSLTIVPGKLPGLDQFSVDVEKGNSGANRVDDNLMEQLTNLLVSHLDVPPAALNQLSEPEYAKSLVTYNLFFAKKITRYQRIWCSLIEEFIKSYTTFDPKFKQALTKTIAANGKYSLKEKLPNQVKKMAKYNPNQYHTTISNLVEDILENVTVKLASPNIVVDKAQFNEVRDFLSNLNELADQFFPDDMIPDEDNSAKAAVRIHKAQWRRQQLMKFLENVGSFSMVDVPDLDDMTTDDVVDFIQTMQNTNSRLDRQRNVISRFPNHENRDSGVGGGDDYGSGDDFGGGGDDFGSDFGGGDDFGGDATEEATSDEGMEMPEMPDEGGEDTTASMYVNIHKKK